MWGWPLACACMQAYALIATHVRIIVTHQAAGKGGTRSTVLSTTPSSAPPPPSLPAGGSAAAPQPSGPATSQAAASAAAAGVSAGEGPTCMLGLREAQQEHEREQMEQAAEGQAEGCEAEAAGSPEPWPAAPALREALVCVFGARMVETLMGVALRDDALGMSVTG